MGLAQRKIDLGEDFPSEELLETPQFIEVGDDTRKAANDVMGGGLDSPDDMAPERQEPEAYGYTRNMCRPPTSQQCRPTKLYCG